MIIVGFIIRRRDNPGVTEFTKLVSAFVAVLALCVTCIVTSADDGRSPDFETEIAPLLNKRCVECHCGSSPAGGLSLTSHQGLTAGGDSGAVIGADFETIEECFFLERITSGEMPPEKQGQPQKLPESEIALIRAWLSAGAPWPQGRELDYFERTNDVRAGRDWWSLQPVVRPPIPKLVHQPQPANPIDAFIGARLEAEGVQPAPKADKRTLIRRVYYDLIGLPPTAEQIEAFVHDDDPDAWGNLIDRLLQMPQYGERWGRYWLDLARYADTSGYERDQEKPFAWKYRDWVVSAFNQDMPYDQFIIQQLAGDEISDRSEQSVIATGFLRLGAWNDEPNDPADYQYERLEDLVHTTSSTFMALTVKCARCHLHKFDAITQEDYYRVASAFWTGPIDPSRSRQDLGGPTSDELGFEQVLGWTDTRPESPPLFVLKNGERLQPLDEVTPASLSSIPSLEHTFDPPPDGARTTHRRLELARWMTDPQNPLTTRVMVNRLWQHHFGQGIVRTPNNFGFLADPPTHPELLDWLADEFQRRGQRLKAMHRLILTSQTWQQSSLHPDADQIDQRDSGNRWWWRAERRRLEAETLRDSLLAASGELDLTVGGEGFKPTIEREALEGLSKKGSAWQASEPQDQLRRSLYLYLKRGLLPPIMTTFDLCDPTASCGKRDVTVVPTQSLAMLNHQFVHDRSLHLADTISKQYVDPTARVRQAWGSILGREPTAQQLDRSLRHLEQQVQNFAAAEDDSRSLTIAQIELDSEPSLVFHLRGDQARVSEQSPNRVDAVSDLSAQSHTVVQPDVNARPLLEPNGFGGKPTLMFDGKGRFLHVKGTLLSRPVCSFVAVVSDASQLASDQLSSVPGHREIISNWNGAAGNSTSSLFVGLTGENTVRFSDVLPAAARVSGSGGPYVLTVINGDDQVSLYQNGRLLAQHDAVKGRRLDTDWVIGQQGNIGGEYWHGGIAEIRVYDRDLSEQQRTLIEQQLADRYQLSLHTDRDEIEFSPDTIALASLCHVLMNSNEFLYVD